MPVRIMIHAYVSSQLTSAKAGIDLAYRCSFCTTLVVGSARYDIAKPCIQALRWCVQSVRASVIGRSTFVCADETRSRFVHALTARTELPSVLLTGTAAMRLAAS